VFHCAIKRRIEGGREKETGKTGRWRHPVEMQRRRREVDLTRGPDRSVREEEGREKWATGGERPAERTGPLG
jgi:hypothetical protein